MDTILLQKSTERLNLQEGQLIHRDGDQLLEVYPLASTEQILVYGNGQITTQALKECLKEGIRVLCLNQYKLAFEPERSLAWAKSLLNSKLHGILIETRRLSEKGCKFEIKKLHREIKQNQHRLYDAGNLEELRGIEGLCARRYFEIFPKVLPAWCKWTGRSYHPPEGLVNLLLSMTYSHCAMELRKLCEIHSLDPHCGYLHKPCYSGGGLPYDLLEPVRATICDHFVLMLLNRRQSEAALMPVHQKTAEDVPDHLREKIWKQFRSYLMVKYSKQQKTPLNILRLLVEETVHGLNDATYIPDYMLIHPER